VSYKIDKSPPVITPTVTPASPDGSNGWYTSDVTVSWSTSDPTSGVSTSSGCGSTTTTSDTTGATLTCSATNSAGLSNSASVTYKIDKSPPVITPTVTPASPNGCNGWIDRAACR